jgi:nitroimidazol reductase NimA-like FMN-containing flavoprotein (pyridoxamine 5'-phosphate oxidase superfamily)
MLPIEDCLRLLASVPVGRFGFHLDGEVVVMPVNHLVDGQNVVFRSARGSKLSAAESLGNVVFEADDYDANSRTGWSVLVNGRAEVVYDDTETRALDARGLDPWASAVDRPFWVRVRPTSISGRLISGGDNAGSAAEASSDQGAVAGRDDDVGAVRVFNVLAGEASHVCATPFGEVGTVFSGRRMELVWVRKHGEPIDDSWFRMKEVDLIVVMQGQLKLEFDSPGEQDRVLGTGEVLVLPADARCRAYRWPRDAENATIFMAAYPMA